MPSETVSVLIDGQPVQVTSGTSVLQYLQQTDQLDPTAENPIVITSVNGRRTSLAETLWGEEHVRLIRLNDPQARTTVQRSGLFLLAVAAGDLFPDHELCVDFSYGGGVFCEMHNAPPLTPEQITQLEDRMRELVSMDLAMTPQNFGLRALLKIYARTGQTSNYQSAKYVRRDTLTLFRMTGFDQLYYGRQLPSTGYIRQFRLQPADPGFVLLTGKKTDPDQVEVFQPQPKLLATLHDYSRWAGNLGVHDTGHLNEYIVNGRTSDLIQISEARHAKFFVDAAQQVGDMPPEGRLILLAGPSSSGKTSSAKRLEVQLRVLGFKPFALSLDNYFVDRADTPLAPDGDYDYESIEALKLDLFNEHLQALMHGEDVFLPRYNFHTGEGEVSDTPTRLEKGQPLLVEGIHALNPRLTPSVSDTDKLLVYVSALCHLNIDNFTYIKTTHSRLFRRIVRDAKFRGYTASETLARWPKVRHGEETHIFPFQNNADLFFNSGLTYELAVLKLWAEPRLAAVDPDDPNYGLARSLIDLLSLLLPIDASQVPPTSLLREFIGGSGFDY